MVKLQIKGGAQMAVQRNLMILAIIWEAFCYASPTPILVGEANDRAIFINLIHNLNQNIEFFEPKDLVVPCEMVGPNRKDLSLTEVPFLTANIIRSQFNLSRKTLFMLDVNRQLTIIKNQIKDMAFSHFLIIRPESISDTNFYYMISRIIRWFAKEKPISIIDLRTKPTDRAKDILGVPLFFFNGESFFGYDPRVCYDLGEDKVREKSKQETMQEELFFFYERNKLVYQDFQNWFDKVSHNGLTVRGLDLFQRVQRANQINLSMVDDFFCLESFISAYSVLEHSLLEAKIKGHINKPDWTAEHKGYKKNLVEINYLQKKIMKNVESIAYKFDLLDKEGMREDILTPKLLNQQIEEIEKLPNSEEKSNEIEFVNTFLRMCEIVTLISNSVHSTPGIIEAVNALEKRR